MSTASRDDNFVTTLLAVSSVDGVTPVTLYANPTTHRLLVDLAGGGSGTVQTVAVATANGFAGTSDGNAAAPTLTLTTSVIGILKGNGAAMSAVTIGSGLSFNGTTLSATGGGTGTVTSVSVVTANGVSGSVATATTTPAITLTLGAITPTSVSATSFVAATPATDTIAGVFRRNNGAQAANILEIQSEVNATLASFNKDGDLLVPDEAYGAGWNGSLEVPTKNAVYDKIETVGNVSKVGTPVNGQVGVWTGDGTIEGTTGLTFASNVLGVGTAANGTITSNGNFDLVLKTGNATTGNITIIDGANGDIQVNPNGNGSLLLGGSNGKIKIDSGVPGILTTASNQNIKLSTNDGTNSGIVEIKNGLNGNINLTPNGTGAVAVSTTIELGHASDTTISRSAAGVIAVEGVVIPSISSTNTLTNKRITKRTGTTTSSATPTINTDNVDEYYITAQTVDITSFTTNLSGTPTEGQTLFIAVTGTAARAITWGASFENGPVALPTTTVTTTRLDVLFKWNTVTSKWRCMASGSTV